MSELKPIEGTELTAYVVRLLQKHFITTVRDFFDANVSKIAKMVNLPEHTIIDLQQKLRQMHGPKRWLLSEYYKNIWQNSWKVYGTGIRSLDDMLGGEGFTTGSVWEICGLSGVGKTQFCHTLALNFTSSYKDEVLYLDTKGDFSGQRIRQMVRSRNLQKSSSKQVMCNIKVERTYSAEGVISILKQLLQQLEGGDKNAAGMGIKIVIIDALPAVWLQYCGDYERKRGKYLLRMLAGYIKKLAKKHFIAILLVNLLLTTEDVTMERYVNNEPLHDESEPSTSAANVETSVHLALGRYWISIPRVRISIEMPESEVNLHSSVRLLRVLKSCYSRTGDSCYADLTAAGIM